MDTSIPQRLKKLRLLSKFSQQEVANQLFITQAAYSLIETGHNSIMVDHIIRLSKLYKRTTDFLILGTDRS